MRHPTAVAATLLAGALAGCESRSDFADIETDQREVMYRIGRIEGLLQQLAGAPTAPAAKPGTAEAPPVDPNKTFAVAVGSSPVKGPAEARVTIVEFSDFQCPPCGESRPLLKRVLAAHPKDVKLVYKTLPLPSIHPNALGAAKAAVAAGRQGKFWEMHDVLYENQEALDADKLPDYAARIGLDVERWKRDIASADVQQQVATDVREARANGIDSTPTFLVNGKQLGERSFDAFEQLIAAALAAPR
ncbi:MAG: thioredoxin domain-containing protein [Candidatus Binatia bacterium]